MTNIKDLSVHQLQQAISIKEQIEQLQAQLDSITGDGITTTAFPTPSKGRRKMSPAARARIAAGQRARWAKVRGGKAVAKATAGPKRRRKMSAAVKAKLAAIARARWAKVKAAGKSAL